MTFFATPKKIAQKKSKDKFFEPHAHFFAPVQAAVNRQQTLMFATSAIQKKEDAKTDVPPLQDTKFRTIQKVDGPWRLGKRHAAASTAAKAAGNTARDDENGLLDAADVGLNAAGISGTVSDEYGVRGNAGLTTSDERNLGAAAGGTDFLAMFTGIATAVKEFRDTESSGADKVGAVASGIHAGMTGAKGASAIVDKAAKIHLDNATGIGESALAAGNIAGITDAFGTIKETFFAVKEIIELVREAQSMSSEEKFRASMSIIRHSLDAAKSGVSAVKSFLDTWGNGIAAPLMQATPGLGIAFSCAELVMEGVSLVTAEIRKADMRQKKQALKTNIGGVAGTSSKAAAEGILADPNAPDAQKAAAKEYLLAKSVQYINQKRSIRTIVPIVSAMLQIAGDAATLGGASAPVGVGLKAGAVGLIAADGKAGPARVAAMENCADYLSGIGFSVQEMHRYRTDPDKLRHKMIEALKSR